ncbi:heterokaryon incompatibility protein-domain-containing protein [Sordaria brevicollis]|uniref:Heterokaryon incompatibility protein-domain-containing protein n=1 Tax=Sordaria brevicollis TaxID=83679 RepID=A0AAE0PN24_SORBR|nr:heterokaryon incompatibility protein-domain-containing protein [Sordaria brevicollis]
MIAAQLQPANLKPRIMGDTSDLHRTFDEKRVKSPGVDGSGVLAPVNDGAPAASDNNSAVAVTAPWCDDCKSGWWGHRIITESSPLCPVCSFLLASAIRRGLEVDYQLITKWLDDCGKHHGDACFCSPSDLDLIVGFQLVDCVSRRIIPASEADGTIYATLSYVWGTTSSSKTSEDIDGERSVKTLPNRLPQVVEDSIRVVNELGFRYLWVDKYCIPQDDTSAKHAQIRLMDRIYSRSAMTIIAAAGDDEEYGLPGVGSRQFKPELRIELAGVLTCAEPPQQLRLYHPPKDDIILSTWNTRGWTYQEALLSRRRLVFTDNQVFFQCQQMMYEEGKVSPTLASQNNDDPSVLAFPSPAAISLSYTVWERIREFVERKLSFDRDALDAISGILNMYRSMSAPSNGSRLFVRFAPVSSESFGKTWVLASSLLWRSSWLDSAFGWQKNELSSEKLDRPRRKGFPSWTWVGWKSTSQHVLIVSRVVLDEEHAYKCAIRAVYEGHNVDLSWEKDAEQILKNSALGLHPRFLDIKGACFDVGFTWGKPETPYPYQDSPNDTWIYTEPVACKLAGCTAPNLYMPPNTLEQVAGKVHRLVGLTFTKKKFEDGRVEVIILLLQPVEYSAGRWVYERVTKAYLGFRDQQSVEQFEAGLEERELRLG